MGCGDAVLVISDKRFSADSSSSTTIPRPLPDPLRCQDSAIGAVRSSSSLCRSAEAGPADDGENAPELEVKGAGLAGDSRGELWRTGEVWRFKGGGRSFARKASKSRADGSCLKGRGEAAARAATERWDDCV